MVHLDRSVTAPAKVNLSLRVLGRRSDGYHQLDSLFLPLSFSDQLTIRARSASTVSVRCNCPQRPELAGEDNLAARAARLLLQHAGVNAEVEIEIDKRIWQAAGLGGGSSDAAAVLLALNAALAERAVSPVELARVALELGADVPYFLDPGPRRARGIGEQLTRVAGLPALALVLANPGICLPTADVFCALGLTPGTELHPAPQPEHVDGSLATVAALMINDLEPAAIRLCPRIARLKEGLLAAGAIAACMSGSGATVFGLCENESHAQRVAAQLREGEDALVLCTTTGPSSVGPVR